MNDPLVGTRENNYRFFYVASISAIFSLFTLFIITGYTAFISTDVSKLTGEINEVMEDVKIILPDIQEALRVLYVMCKHENFTKSYGNICG